jgi:hypothetical protein
MTDDKIALRELLEKGSDASFLREMIGFAAERLMALAFSPSWASDTTSHYPLLARVQRLLDGTA